MLGVMSNSLHTFIYALPLLYGGFPGGLDIKESACNEEEPLEKRMATRSSIPAWRISLTEEPTVHGVSKSQARPSD